jgi:hypothetical protein
MGRFRRAKAVAGRTDKPVRRGSPDERQAAFLREHRVWNERVDKALDELDEIVEKIDRSRNGSSK